MQPTAIVRDTRLNEFLCGLAAMAVAAFWFWLGS